MSRLSLSISTLAMALSAMAIAVQSHAADAAREAEVAAKGAQVMPFSLAATTHIFTKTKQGGIQQVIAKTAGDTEQIRLIRQHLQEIAGQFSTGDFTAPTHIHGAAMPGLATLAMAKPGEIRIQYLDRANGGQVEYATKNATLAAALHQWFDAQLADHGADAQAGHASHGAASLATER